VTITWQQLREGLEAPSFQTGPLTRTDFVRYQGASGDMNPIHHDDDFAKAAGYPSVFAVGMLGAGIAATRLTEWLGEENVRGFKVKFREQAWPGDVLTFHAVVVGRREAAGERLADLEFRIDRDGGPTHLTGLATFVVPE
jgi:acyl dehydratase